MRTGNQLLFEFACVLTVAWPVTAQIQAVPLFDDSSLKQIDLTVEPDDWALLLQNYNDSTYYPATLTWNGLTVTVGIKQHGSTSRSPIKPNLTVKFGKYVKHQTFLGLSSVLLKANNQDASGLREFVSMKFFRMMGFPAPREAPAKLFVNGQYFGLYMIVECIDEPSFLERNFGESGGYLYKINANGSYGFNNLGTDPSAYGPLLELKSDQDAPDLQTFCDLVQAINQPLGPGFSDADFVAAVSKYIDPRSFLTYAATENVLADKDGLVGGIVGMNNFYLYQFQHTTFYQLIPWDKDLTFDLSDRDILTGFTLPPVINVLAQRLIEVPEYRSFYFEQVAKAADLLGAAGGWADNRVTEEYEIIKEPAENDPNKQCGFLISCGAAAFQDDVQWVRGVLTSRAPFIQAQLASDGYQPLTDGPLLSTMAVLGRDKELTARLAPGAIVTLAGDNLGLSGQALTLPLPRILNGTFVSIEGVRAPLFATSSGEIMLQVPGDLPPGPASIVASVNGKSSNTFRVTLEVALPSILAVAHGANGVMVSEADPVIPGEVLTIYMSGLGTVNSDLPIGSPAPLRPPAETVATPQALLGDNPLIVMFSGLVPGYVGLYQVNVALRPTLHAVLSGRNRRLVEILNVFQGEEHSAVQPQILWENLVVTCNGESASARIPVARE